MSRARRSRSEPEEGRPWLKATLDAPPVPPRPWLPPRIHDAGYDESTVTTLTYIVVEEIIGSRVGLSLCAWPDADPEGRLRFALDSVARVGASIGDLSELVARANGERAMEIRIGDAFAAEIVEPIEPGARPDAWMKEPIDITPEARKLSKLAFYAAATDILSKDDAKRWSMTTLEV